MIWFICFLLTQLIEMPFYYRMIDAGRAKKLLWGFGASAITHPLLWFLLPWEYAPYFYLLLAGEAAVFLVEGYYFKALGVSRPFYMATLANSVSMLAGVALDYFNLTGYILRIV